MKDKTVKKIQIEAISWKQSGACAFCEKPHRYLVPIDKSDNLLGYIFLCEDHFKRYEEDGNFLKENGYDI